MNKNRYKFIYSKLINTSNIIKYINISECKTYNIYCLTKLMFRLLKI